MSLKEAVQISWFPLLVFVLSAIMIFSGSFGWEFIGGVLLILDLCWIGFIYVVILGNSDVS